MRDDPRRPAGELDRRESSRELARVHAFIECGRPDRARAAAWTLAQMLRAAGLLPADLDGLVTL